MVTFVLPKSELEVEVPNLGAEWGLYTIEKPCARPARALKTAMIRALRKLDAKCMKKGGCKNEIVDDLITEFLAPVYTKYADFGSSDGELRTLALNLLNDTFGRLIAASALRAEEGE